MNIKELLEAGDKRTKGEWSKSSPSPIIAGARGHRKIIVNSVDSPFSSLTKKQKEDNVAYIANAPKMEAKLREIVDILPEIKETIGLAKDEWDYPGSTRLAEIVSLLEKLAQWENN